MATTRRSGREGLRPRLLRLKDAALYLSVSPGKLRTIIQNGELSVIKVGDGTAPWLIDITEIDKWIDRQKVTL
jgi:excisionase family DNA binding protein